MAYVLDGPSAALEFLPEEHRRMGRENTRTKLPRQPFLVQLVRSAEPPA